MKNSDKHKLIEKLIEKRKQENTALQKLLIAMGHKVDGSGGEKDPDTESREDQHDREKDLKK